MRAEKPEPLTRSQKEQLVTELAELEGPRRAAAVEAIERRITVLRDRLQRAVLVDEEAVDSGSVGVGSKVELKDERGERMDVEISSVGGVSPDSPLGRSLMGAKAGDEVEVAAPSGTWRARVVSIGR